MKRNRRRTVHRVVGFHLPCKHAGQTWHADGAADSFARTLDRFVTLLPSAPDDWVGRAVLGAAQALADLHRTAARLDRPAAPRGDLATSLGIAMD